MNDVKPEPVEAYRLCDLPYGTKYQLNEDDVVRSVARWSHPKRSFAKSVVVDFSTSEAAQEFADRLTAPYYGDNDPERERLLREEAEIELRAAIANRDALANENELLCLQAWDADPYAPPIPCVPVDPTDGRPTWRAMGEDVRTLGDEWERQRKGWPSTHWATNLTLPDPDAVYLIRRTQPPKPTTDRPGGWVPGIGWVALLTDLSEGDEYARTVHVARREPWNLWTAPLHPTAFSAPVIVIRWADGTVPTGGGSGSVPE